MSFECATVVDEVVRQGLHGQGQPSCFALLQKNVLNRHRWDTRDQLRQAIVAWIEQAYHHRRRQARLGRLTPVEFETIYAAASAA